MQRDPALAPSPLGGWSTSLRTLDNAVVVPPQAFESVLRTGVFSAKGVYCKRAAVWRREQPATVTPDRVESPKELLPGRYLWGGVLYGHFGHFLMESTTRLWALGALNGVLNGVVFAAADGPGQAEIKPYQADFLAFLSGDVPVKVIKDVTQIERLEVAGQGFGLGSIAVGTEPFRRYVRQKFPHDIKGEGPNRLFISRSGQGLSRGGFVGEAILDARMKKAGFTVFHPELSDIATQISRYRAAKQIVGLDGSAFHLFAMVGREDQQAALILRRKSGRSSSLRRHMSSFTGRQPVLIEALKSKEKSETLGKKQSILELDMAVIGEGLKDAGFLDRNADWGPLEPDEIAFVAAEWERAKEKVNGA